MEEKKFFVHESSYIDDDVAIGDGTKVWHFCHILSHSRTGKNCKIGQNVLIGPEVTIGNNVKIQNNVSVYKGVTLEDDVFLAPGVTIANDPHPVCGLCMRGPTIKRGARIGVNVTLLSHITIGEGALIGAGSVVTRDIPASVVAYGNPARPVKSVEELTCPFGLVERPYANGLDVHTRQAAERS